MMLSIFNFSITISKLNNDDLTKKELEVKRMEAEIESIKEKYIHYNFGGVKF